MPIAAEMYFKEEARAEALEKLVREAIELFNDGLNIGLGWVARAERIIDGQ